MIVDTPSASAERSWTVLALITGLFTIGLQVYLDLFLNLDLPLEVTRVLFFALAPVALVAVVGFLGATWREARRMPHLLGALFLLIAFVFFTVTTIFGEIHVGNLLDRLRGLENDAEPDTLRLVSSGLVVMSQSLNFAARLFLSLGMILLSIALARHPRFGLVWSAVGVVLYSVCLADLFAGFPGRPLEDGYSDFDLLLGGWLVVTLLLLPRGLSRRAPAPPSEAPERAPA